MMRFWRGWGGGWSLNQPPVCAMWISDSPLRVKSRVTGTDQMRKKQTQTHRYSFTILISTVSMDSKNLTLYHWPWDMYNSHLKWVTQEVLLYTYLGANDMSFFLPNCDMFLLFIIRLSVLLRSLSTSCFISPFFKYYQIFSSSSFPLIYYKSLTSISYLKSYQFNQWLAVWKVFISLLAWFTSPWFCSLGDFTIVFRHSPQIRLYGMKHKAAIII